ncbi:MAG: DUF6390 family protein [Actinomycetota bacterium]|nr:DUF6390 family protein [Actinomycetota bacterium]
MRSAAAEPEAAEPLLFVRCAYPPNQLGYCGPADNRPCSSTERRAWWTGPAPLLA